MKPTSCLLACLLIISGSNRGLVSAAQGSANEDPIIRPHAPKALAAVMKAQLPLVVKVNRQVLEFRPNPSGVWEGKSGELMARILHEYNRDLNALWYQLVFENKGSNPIGGITVEPLALRFAVQPPEVLPRIRYLTGSFHYDACYPSRAFQEVERVFMTHDHAKPVSLGGANAYDYVPMLQFAFGPDPHLAGFMVGFEWSAGWSMTAGWERANSFTGEPLCDFLLKGTMALGNFNVQPGRTVSLPKVHLVFFEGNGWSHLDNAQKRYIRERIAHKVNGQPNVNKVTYDHWFGIHSDFDLDEMMRQAKRAAELGCEYFCLDAGWYGKGAFGASGKGEWDEPDPVKFPNGSADMKKWSDYCRNLGMGFGVWHQVETRNGAGPSFDMATESGRDGAL